MKNLCKVITMSDRIHRAIVEEMNSELRRRDLKIRALPINTKASPETLLIELSDGADSEKYVAGLIFKDVQHKAVELAVRSQVEPMVVIQGRRKCPRKSRK